MAWLRDTLLPFCMGGMMFFISHDWILGTATAGAFFIVRLGYGNYSPEDDPKPSLLAKITKDRQGALIRAIYGLIVGLVGLAPYLVKTGHVVDYLAYSAGVSAVCYVVVKLRSNIYWTDITIGLAVSSINFLRF